MNDRQMVAFLWLLEVPRMLNTFFLCAIMAGGANCLPFDSMEACWAAQSALTSDLIDQSDCAAAEVRGPHIGAPDFAPLPIPRKGVSA